MTFQAAFCAGASLLCVAQVIAQPAPPDVRPDFYSRRVWQSSEGLPEDFTQAFAQTPDGYLWIGTSGGLARFDGVRFAVFNSSNEAAFGDDSVYSLLTTRDGTLWAGTDGGGLIRYQQGTFRAFGAAQGLTNPFVRVLFEDRAGRLWVGTDRGLFRLDGETLHRVDDRNGAPSMSVHAICEDREGRLLVGGVGLLILDGARVVALQFNRKPRRQQHSNHPRNAGRCRLDRNDRRPAADRWRHPRDPFAAPKLVDDTNISVLWEGQSGHVWVGTYGRGLMRSGNGRLVTMSAPVSIPHNNVLAVFEDAEQNVWVGTQGGMLRLQPGAANTVTPIDGAPLSINTIYQDPRGPVFVAALGWTAVPGRAPNARAG